MHGIDSLILLYSGRNMQHAYTTLAGLMTIYFPAWKPVVYICSRFKSRVKMIIRRPRSDCVVECSSSWPSCGHCIIGVIRRLLHLGPCEIFERGGRLVSKYSFFQCLHPCLGERLECSPCFVNTSFSFEAIHGEYLSRTQQLCKGWPSCQFCTCHKLAPWSHTTCI